MIDGGVHAPPMNWFLFIKRSGNSDGSKANREIAETVTNQQVDLPPCAIVAPPSNRWNGFAHSGKIKFGRRESFRDIQMRTVAFL